LTSIKTITSSYGATGNAALSLSGADGSTKANLINFGYDGETQQPAYIGYLCTSGAGSTRGDLVFATRSGTSDTAPAERVRITADGLTFNGDTAAANALDDYEEGTFTATLKGGTTDPTTPVTTTGTYTKIGRQVQVNIFFDNVNTTGASGDVIIAGLPFTSSSTAIRYTGSIVSFNFTFGGTALGTFMGTSGTQFEILSSVTNGAWSNMTHATTGAARFLTIAHTYSV
jgi:hypothetical protein